MQKLLLKKDKHKKVEKEEMREEGQWKHVLRSVLLTVAGRRDIKSWGLQGLLLGIWADFCTFMLLIDIWAYTIPSIF